MLPNVYSEDIIDPPQKMVQVNPTQKRGESLGSSRSFQKKNTLPRPKTNINPKNDAFPIGTSFSKGVLFGCKHVSFREDIQNIFFKRNFPPGYGATKPQRESAQDRSFWAWADWHRGHVVSMRCGPWSRSTRNFWDPISTWLGEQDEHRIFVSVQFFRATLVFWMLYTYISGWCFQSFLFSSLVGEIWKWSNLAIIFFKGFETTN